MNNVVGLAIFAVGIVLLIFGFNESQTVGSEISRTFTGSLSNREMWLLISGAAAVILGLALAVSSRRS